MELLRELWKSIGMRGQGQWSNAKPGLSPSKETGGQKLEKGARMCERLAVDLVDDWIASSGEWHGPDGGVRDWKAQMKWEGRSDDAVLRHRLRWHAASFNTSLAASEAYHVAFFAKASAACIAGTDREPYEKTGKGRRAGHGCRVNVWYLPHDAQQLASAAVIILPRYAAEPKTPASQTRSFASFPIPHFPRKTTEDVSFRPWPP